MSPIDRSEEAHQVSKSMSTLLEARDLSKHFGGLVAVSGVNLSLAHHQIHAVIGTNGAGKSTLIHLLSGELKPSD